MEKPISLLDIASTHVRELSHDEIGLFGVLSMVSEVDKNKFDHVHARRAGLGSQGLQLLKLLEDMSKIAVIDNSVAVFIIDLAGSKRDRIVMWAWTLHCMQKRHLDHVLTLSDFSSYFPIGVPSSAGYEFVWQAQKFKSENLLDLNSIWV